VEQPVVSPDLEGHSLVLHVNPLRLFGVGTVVVHNVSGRLRVSHAHASAAVENGAEHHFAQDGAEELELNNGVAQHPGWQRERNEETVAPAPKARHWGPLEGRIGEREERALVVPEHVWCRLERIRWRVSARGARTGQEHVHELGGTGPHQGGGLDGFGRVQNAKGVRRIHAVQVEPT
jgi:hypothetical protein